MSIIVDTNCASQLTNSTPDGKPVLEWLLCGKGKLVLGGLLKRELARSGLQPILITLDRAGRLIKLNDAMVDKISKELTDKKICVSNDQHVLAVAIDSGCRLIFTKDKNLHKDAKNLKILNPAASIYGSKNHKHLLN